MKLFFFGGGHTNAVAVLSGRTQETRCVPLVGLAGDPAAGAIERTSGPSLLSAPGNETKEKLQRRRRFCVSGQLDQRQATWKQGVGYVGEAFWGHG